MMPRQVLNLWPIKYYW